MDQLYLHDVNPLKVFTNPLIMKYVLKSLSCLDFQRLRKVCHGIRNCVDIIKPDPRVTSILIKGMNINRTEMDISFKCSYINTTAPKISHKYFDGKFLSYDFGSLLRDQKSIMEELRFEFSYEYYFRSLFLGHGGALPVNYDVLSNTTKQFLANFKNALSTRNIPLRVEKFHMETKHQDEVLEVFPYLCSSCLKDIELQCLYSRSRVMHLNLDQIAELDQWKNAKTLKMSKLIIDTPIQQMNITHFAEIDVHVTCISKYDVAYLKNALLASPTFERFRISFAGSSMSESLLYRLLGMPSVRPNDHLANERKVWYFGIPNSDHVSFLFYYVSQSVTFNRVHSSVVPLDAVIQN